MWHQDRGRPGKHGISQAAFLYVIEPGGNRVELFGDAGYLIFDPAWKPITWREKDLEKGIIWCGGSLPAEFFTYGTPPVPADAVPKRPRSRARNRWRERLRHRASRR